MSLGLHCAAHTDSTETIQQHLVSPVEDIHPCSALAESTQPVKHSYTCPVYKPSFFYIPSCLMLPAARHSCFLASQLFFRIVAHTAVPPNVVASYPEGRLVQDSFPFESSFCLSRKDDSFLSSPPALLQWQTWTFVVFFIMTNFRAETIR